MSQLSNDLRDDNAENESRARGSRRHDNVGPNAKVVESSTEDSFFENLMAELGGALDKPDSKSRDRVDDDDFFSSLEAELSQSLGGVFQSMSESKEVEMDNRDTLQDDFFSSSDADNFFLSLIDDLTQEMSNEEKTPEAYSDMMTSTKEISTTHGNLSSFTLPQLKDLLRGKGLKV